MLFAMITTLTGKNQITVPAAMAQRYGLTSGARIEWLDGAAPDEIRCRILPSPSVVAASLRGAGRKYLKPGKDPIEQLIMERAAEERDA